MENLNYQKIKYVGYFKINKIVHSLNIMPKYDGLKMHNRYSLQSISSSRYHYTREKRTMEKVL